MTRIFTDGAEMGDALFWDSGNANAVTIVPVPYESAYCYKVGNPKKNLAAISECYFRQRIYINDVTTYYNGWRYPIIYNGATALAWISHDAFSKIYIATPSGTLATAANPINSAQWYLMEVYFKLDDAPNGRFQVYLDGSSIINFTGDTKYAAQTTFDGIEWLNAGGFSYIGLDDLALNDVNGGVDDSWCGDGVVIKVTPNGDGASNDWHGSDGNDVNNFELVDDFPKDDDTSYVYHDGSVSGTQEQYALSDYDGTDKTILRIYPEARLRKTAAAAHTVKLGILASGGTDDMSAARNLSSVYQRVVGNEYLVNPVDSGAWEEADIDALQFVAEVG